MIRSVLKARQQVIAAVSIAVCAVGAAVWGTWPLAGRVSTHVYDPRLDGGPMSWLLSSDVYLTTWILAWDRHALLSDPLSLLDANIFHPARWSLVFSENLLGALPVYLPVSLMSGDAVTAHQATLILTFALAFATSALLVWAWTRCLGAALIAGAVFAFSPFRVGNLPSFHIEGNYLLPLIPLLSRRAVDRHGGLSGVLLAGVLVIETLHSYYLGYAAFLTMGVIGLARFFGGVREARVLILPTIGAIAVAAVATIPYLIVRREGAIGPPTTALLSVGSAELLRTGSTPAVVLALLTLPFWRRGMRRPGGDIWLIGLATTAVVAHAVALGPDVTIFGYALPGPYRLLARIIPGFESVRVPVRFNSAVSMAAAALAGIGLAGARRRLLPTMAGWQAAGVGAVIAATVVYLAVPVPLRTVPVGLTPQEQSTASWLAGEPPAPLLEIPFVDGQYGGTRVVRVSRAMYESTRHWHRLLNGYSGYFPASYRPVVSLTNALPDKKSVALLTRATGLRHIVVHRAELSRDERRRWRKLVAVSGLRVRAVVGSDVVYETDATIAPDLVARLVDPVPRSVTLQGTPRDPLPASQRTAVISVDRPLPSWIVRGIPFDVPVTVRNVSETMWPSLSPTPAHLVGLEYRWEDASGRTVATGNRTQPLPWDLAPGESVSTQVLVSPPPTAGVVRLIVGVVQDDEWFPDPVEAGTLTMQSRN